ncbi:MAG: 3-oxoacyl-[acyl-carrier protein] reductase [Desulfovibrionales bacterium]|nr:3-oxoacyl-[acyl-carrier protein] reductase [Desulfovibrionales bacterium]
MAESYSGRTVLVTGGSSGIGLEICRGLARKGWRVFCHYRSNSDRALALKTEIQEMGRECLLVQADLGNEAGIESVAVRAKELQVDSLVNNAGTYVCPKPYGELGLKDYVCSFTVNAFAPAILASRLFAGMAERGFGRIVNISSVAAKYGGGAQSMHYGAAKRALEGVTKTLAREGAFKGVLVNTLRPGVIDTDFHEKHPKDMAARIALIPMRRLGEASEVARLACFLASEENTFITNETIAVAGGE